MITNASINVPAAPASTNRAAFVIVRRLTTALLLVASCLVGAAESRQTDQQSAGEAAPRVLLETSAGDILLELDPGRAPVTVANFLSYVDAGFYDGTLFHRVIDGFMIQGGGFDTSMQRKPTREPIRNEADNGLKNRLGTIAMARTGDPHSASSQFFINVANNGSLDHRAKNQRGWGYAVFGRVVAGMDTVKTIKSVPTGRRGRFADMPLTPVVIQHASRQTPVAEQ